MSRWPYEMSETSRHVMQMANQEAQKLNHEYIGTEHILLALTQPRFMPFFPPGIEMERVREEVLYLCQSGPSIVTRGQLPMTPRARKVIEIANDLSNPQKIEPNHIILALAMEEEGVASQVLRKLGFQAPRCVLKDNQTPSIIHRLTALEEAVAQLKEKLG